jgi:hypothetical protein
MATAVQLSGVGTRMNTIMDFLVAYKTRDALNNLTTTASQEGFCSGERRLRRFRLLSSGL